MSGHPGSPPKEGAILGVVQTIKKHWQSLEWGMQQKESFSSQQRHDSRTAAADCNAPTGQHHITLSPFHQNSSTSRYWRQRISSCQLWEQRINATKPVVPWNVEELAPPSTNHHSDVEPKDKRQRDKVCETLTVDRNMLKHSAQYTDASNTQIQNKPRTEI